MAPRLEDAMMVFMDRSGSKSISRAELYRRVWETPLSALCKEFGVSDRGLAKKCAHHKIPTPPRGYWRLVETGQAPPQPPLPKVKEDWLNEVVFTKQPKPEPPLETTPLPEETRQAISSISLPNEPSDHHRLVRPWFAEHKRLQRERKKLIEQVDTYLWWRGGKEPLSDLTERDLYRFKITSALLSSAEAAGVKPQSAYIDGHIRFEVNGWEIKARVKEKMRRGLRPPAKDAPPWTAFLDHHQNGLGPSGFLRVVILTYLDAGRKQEWVETGDVKIPDLMAEIVDRIASASEVLEAIERKRAEQRQIQAERDRANAEAARLIQHERHRWEGFKEHARRWEEHARLLAFIDAVKARAELEPDASIDGRSITEWINWAEQKTTEMDPFQFGLGKLFDPPRR